MSQKNTAQIIVIITLAFTTFLSSASGADSKPLSKSEAVQLLTFMSYTNVEVAAIVQGMPTGPNSATVIAIGQSDGVIKKIDMQFLYDADIGWFYYQYDGDDLSVPTTKLKMWTLSGYKEIQPKQPNEADKKSP